VNPFSYVTFIRNLSYYCNEEESRRICRQLGLGHGFLCVKPDAYFQCPSNPVAHSVFRDMAFCSQGRQEMKEFLRLSSGCCGLVDIGASGGFFSVLFAVSRSEPSTILSVEPDPGAGEVLDDLRRRNKRGGVEWKIDARGVMDETRSNLFVSSGYGAELMSALALQNAEARAAENNLVSTTFEVACIRLDTLLSEYRMRPDLLKIDIESFEFELVQSSIDLLREVRPRLMLELHVALLRARGRDPERLLASLSSIGYRRLQQPAKNLTTLISETDDSGVVRVGLVVGHVS
jgi:FkbM family methyltransferase